VLSAIENRDKLQQALGRIFKSVLKPERVKAVKITSVRGNVVSGFLLTHCPVGDRDNWKDFEAHIPNNEVDPAVYMIVDGRRFKSTLLDKGKYEFNSKTFTSQNGNQAGLAS
jgi:hypothetical protein